MSIRLTSRIDAILREVEQRSPEKNKRGARRAPPKSATELTNLSQFVEIVSSLSQIVAEALESHSKKTLSSKGVEEIKGFVESLCTNLNLRDLVRLSAQEAEDVNVEIKRLHRLVVLIQIEGGPGFRYLTQADKSAYLSVSKCLRSLSPYPCQEKDAQINRVLKELAEKAKAAITEREIKEVVAAFDLAQGHWFKCPNGHPYIITECGGAMQEGTCNECGARIGGRNHQLRSDNLFGGDIDGAAAPLYPTVMMH